MGPSTSSWTTGGQHIKKEPSAMLHSFSNPFTPCHFVEAFKQWMSTRGPELSEWTGPDSAPCGSQLQRWDKAAEALPEREDEPWQTWKEEEHKWDGCKDEAWQADDRWEDRKGEEQKWDGCKDEAWQADDGWEEYRREHPEEEGLEEEEWEAVEQEWDDKVAEGGQECQPVGDTEVLDLDPEPALPWRVDTDRTYHSLRERSRSSRKKRPPVVLVPRGRLTRTESNKSKQAPRTSTAPSMTRASPAPKQRANRSWLQKSTASQALPSQASQASQPGEEMQAFEPRWLGPEHGNEKKQRHAQRIQ